MGGGEGCHVDHPNILGSYNEAQYEGGIKYRGRNILKRRTQKNIIGESRRQRLL